MRVVIADPPAYTPPYDHALAAALVRQGVDVRLLTSRFRFGRGASPRPASRSTTASTACRAGLGSRRGRLAAKALEHPLALARLGLADCDVAPPAVGRRAGGRRLAPPRARAARLHGPRPPAAANRAPHAHLEAAVSPLRPRRHPQRARPPHTRGVRRPRREAPRHPAPGLPQRSRPGRTTAARCSRSA